MTGRRNRSLRLALAVAAASLTAVALAPLVAFGGDTGTVSAQVTVAAPCIVLGAGSDAVNFGTLSFNTAGSNIFGQSPTLQAQNCSGTEEDILAHGTDATNAAADTWTLYQDFANPCTVGANRYQVQYANMATNIGYALANANQTVAADVGAGAQHNFKLTLLMPCTGSSGAGTTMSFQTVLTATF